MNLFCSQLNLAPLVDENSQAESKAYIFDLDKILLPNVSATSKINSSLCKTRTTFENWRSERMYVYDKISSRMCKGFKTESREFKQDRCKIGSRTTKLPHMQKLTRRTVEEKVKKEKPKN